MYFFKIAKKERDLDNFIEWIVSLYDSDSDDEKSICRKFLMMLLTNFDFEEKIISIKVKREFGLEQVGRIDLLCVIEMSNKIYLLAIENKINAPINNNLKEYANYINNNKENIVRNLNLNIKDIEVKYFVIKIGLTLTTTDKGKINNSPFILIDRRTIIDCLCGSQNYLIKDFLNSIDYSENTKLEDFSRHKDDLASWLSNQLNCSVIFNNKEYEISLTQFNDFKIKINDFSLSSPVIKITLEGDKTKIRTELQNFKTVKKSKNNVIGKKKVSLLDNPTLGALVLNLKELIEMLRFSN